MKKTITAVLFALAGTMIGRADWIYVNDPAVIPDNNSLGLTQTLELSGFTNAIDSIEVSLTLSAAGEPAFNGDYFVSLQHDSGYVVLLNRVGRTAGNSFGYADNGFDVTFSQVGNDIHTYQSGTYTLGVEGELTGTWGVDGRNVDPLLSLDTTPQTSTLTTFNGLDANGTWTLFVADVSENGEGTLESWGINVTTIPEPASLVLVVLSISVLRLLGSRRITGSSPKRAFPG